ncbi:MAG: ribosome silencing factor [Acidobacteria bacterium]|nr:ribosome silencing factor [Acidobacteriota bacterium]
MLSPDITEMLREAVAAAVDRKAFQLVALDVTGLTSLADSFLICSGAHDRQVGAIAEAVERRLRKAGHRPLHVEGARRADWILLDYGDIIVHVLTEDRRSYYGLESLWGDASRVPLEALGLAGATGSP